jgi:hypothetical protein
MGVCKDMIQGRTCSHYYVNSHPVLVILFIEADDEDKKIYVKATEKNYKTSKYDHTKKCKFLFWILIKTPCINAAKSRLRINRDKLSDLI